MDTIKAILQRKSIRSFNDEEIPEDILETILRCGNQAPTARNDQPWEFIVTKKRENIIKLAELTDKGKFLKKAKIAITLLSKETKYFLEDCSAATENILIAARNFNIGSCWIAGDKKPYCEKVLNFLQAPEDFKLISIIALGYTDTEIHGRNTADLKKKIHYEFF